MLHFASAITVHLALCPAATALGGGGVGPHQVGVQCPMTVAPEKAVP